MGADAQARAHYFWIKVQGEWRPGAEFNKEQQLYEVIGLEWEVKAEEVGPEIVFPH